MTVAGNADMAESGTLSQSELQRYSRQIILPGVGVAGQSRLARTRVLVVGAGGLGSTVIPALAAAGIGTVGIIDDDRVEASNLPRQTVHDPSDVGRLKALSAAESVARLNPSTHVIAYDERLSSVNAIRILSAYDLVVDGSDNFPTRYLVDDAATLAGIPSVWGAVHQFGGQVGVGWAAAGPTYRDLFPVPPAPGSVPSCEQAGVLPTVCVIIGGIMASEVLKLVTGVGEPLVGRVTSYDAVTGRFRDLEYGRDPDAAPVTELIDYDLFCGLGLEADRNRQVVSESSGTQSPTAAAVSGQPSSTQPSSTQPSSTEPSSTQPSSTEPSSDQSPAAASQGNPPDRTEQPAANPPAAVEQPNEISVTELATLLRSDPPVQLLDVREPWEASVASIEGSTLIPLGELAHRYGELEEHKTTVIYCHTGVRSEYARQMLRSVGFDDIRSLAGGVDAWSALIDPTIARY